MEDKDIVSVKLIEEGFRKSEIVSNYFDGGVYIKRDPIPYIHRIYETLFDSKGQGHSVQVDYEDKKFKLTEDCFDLKWMSDNEGHIRILHDKCPIEPTELEFQFNLKIYVLLFRITGWRSGLDHFRSITRNMDNEIPECFTNRDYNTYKACERSGFYPLYEHCYGNFEENYIPDRLFFNFPNRKLALDRIRCGTLYSGCDYKKDVFNNFDYINANDKEIVKFMNDRFQKRLKYEQYLKNRFIYIN